MALLLDHVVDIDATPETVWRVLTDFDDYDQWNPLAVRCRSSLVPGEPIDMMVRLGPGPLRKQREWVRTHSPGREFSYAMKPLPCGLLRSLRTQSLTAREGNRTRYTAHFEVRGGAGTAGPPPLRATPARWFRRCRRRSEAAC